MACDGRRRGVVPRADGADEGEQDVGAHPRSFRNASVQATATSVLREMKSEMSSSSRTL